MSKIKLGDKVRCKYTGFTGIVVAKTEFINGCIQYGIVPKVGKDKAYPEEVSIDEDSLVVIGKKKVKKRKKPTGGPTRAVPRLKGY